MANKLVHSFSIALLLFSSLLFFELASARPLAATTSYSNGLSTTFSNEAHSRISLEQNWGKFELEKPRGHNYRKLGSAFGPALMNMLPKGPIPVSGPSRRINDVKN